MRPRLRLAAVAALAITALVAGFACTGFRTTALLQEGGAESAPPSLDGEPLDGSVDAGSPFTVVQAVPDGETLTSIWGAGPDDIFVVGTNGVRYVYTQGSWTRSQQTLGYDYQCVAGNSGSDVYAVGIDNGTDGGIISHFDGTSWTEEFEAPVPLYGVIAWGDTVLAVGAKGMIFGQHTEQPGWSSVLGASLPPNPAVVYPPADKPNEPILWGIAGSSIDDFAMPADLDRVFHAKNAAEFINLDPTVDRTISFRSVFGVPTNPESYFFGSNYFGVVWLTTNGPPDAAQLTDNGYYIFQDRETAGASASFIHGIWGTTTEVLFVGDLGRIYTYSAASNGFGPVVSPVTDSLFGVWGSSASDVWVVGQRELIMHGALPAN